MVGNGIYGYIFRLDKDRVVKVARTYAPDLNAKDFSFDDTEYMEYMSEINRKTIDNEIKVYERLGHHRGLYLAFRQPTMGLS